MAGQARAGVQRAVRLRDWSRAGRSRWTVQAGRTLDGLDGPDDRDDTQRPGRFPRGEHARIPGTRTEALAEIGRAVRRLTSAEGTGAAWIVEEILIRRGKFAEVRERESSVPVSLRRRSSTTWGTTARGGSASLVRHRGAGPRVAVAGPACSTSFEICERRMRMGP